MIIIPAGALSQPVEIKLSAAPSTVSLPAIGTQTWMADNMDRRAGTYYCGDTKTGFSGLPSGYRHRENGSWTSPGELTYFWSSTENASDAADAWIRGLGLASRGVYRASIPKTHALPVRCLKN
jgi:hypothetical protein